MPCVPSEPPDICREFRVELYDSIFYTGQNVEGKAIITVFNEFSVEGVIAQIFGIGKVQFESYNHVMFKEQKVYMNECQTIASTCQLPKGRHEFPFSIHLPQQ